MANTSPNATSLVIEFEQYSLPVVFPTEILRGKMYIV